MVSQENRWETFAKEDAEYYILTDPAADYATAAGRELFFLSGERATEASMARIVDLLPARETAVEIGCGIGRLALPHAALFRHVRAVDVSPTMLSRLRVEMGKRGVRNMDTFEPGDRWDAPDVDYVYSSHVFQHIEDMAVIEGYIRRIAAALKVGGIARLHFDTRRKTLPYRLRNAMPDWMLRRPWRKEIRRIRRDPAIIRRLHTVNGLEIVREQQPSSDRHIFVSRRASKSSSAPPP